MEGLFYQYNPWWEDKDLSLPGIISRDSYLDWLKEQLSSRSITFLTGLRRIGKTTLMKLVIQDLIRSGTEAKTILYISLDDFLLRGLSLDEIVSQFRKVHQFPVDRELTIFLDEITSLPEYHQQLKNLYDRYPVKIFASSSSSSLLLDRKAYLTGRSRVVEVEPLDFEEFKQFRNITVKQRDGQLNEPYFREYLRYGGLPEHVLHPSREYLNSLVDDIIQKDITAYHGLKNHQLLRDFFVLLMERSGKQVSINKVANILGISPDTARRYLAYFESTYLVHTIQRWGKTNEKRISPKKLYACDLGIKYHFNGERDLGSYFENYIYLKLKARKDVYYLYEGGNEIDFLTGDGILIESKYFSTMNQKQETLFDAFPAKQKLLIDDLRKVSLLDSL